MSDLKVAVRRSSLWMVVRILVSLTVGAFVTTYIIRSLSVRDYGIYNVLYSLIGYVSVFASFGIPSVLGRYLPEALQKNNYTLIHTLVVRGLRLRMLFSIVTVGLLFLLHGSIGRLLKIEGFLDYFYVFAFSIIFALEAELMTSVLHALFLHKYSVIASTCHVVIRGVCLVLAILTGHGLMGVLIAELCSWAWWVAIQWSFYHLKFSRLHPAEVDPELSLRRYFRYGVYAAFSKYGGTVLGASTDYFVITAFLGPGAVAFYAFSKRVISLLSNCLPHLVLSDVIAPSFIIKYSRDSDVTILNNMFNFLLKISAFSVFPLAAGLFVLGDKMITIVFKSEYLDARPILLILAGLMVVGIVERPVSLVLQTLEQIQIKLHAKVFAVYNLLLELIVVQYYGVIGVVLVTASANLMTVWYLYYHARKLASLRLDFSGLSSIVINSLLMAVVVCPFRQYATGFLSLGIIVLLGVVAYLIFSWLNKSFNEHEREWINSVSPWPVFVF